MSRFAALPFVIIFSSLSYAAEHQGVGVPINNSNPDYQIVGRLGQPMGKITLLKGVILQNPSKGYEGGVNLSVQCIDGVYSQKRIRIPLVDKRLKDGVSYEIEGYETGRYVGMPQEQMRRIVEKGGLVPQTTGFHFSPKFFVLGIKKIDPVSYTPQMFKSTKGVLSGIARTKDGNSVMEGDGWNIIIKRDVAWPKDIEGKVLETKGLYNPDETWAQSKNLTSVNFEIVDGHWCLAKLRDQVGKKVRLEGMARSLNGEWWFHYKGTDLYVENMKEMPGWSVHNHWRPMVIEGDLEKAKLPRIDQISLKPDRDLQEYYIVRKARWKPLDQLLAPQLEIHD